MSELLAAAGQKERGEERFQLEGGGGREEGKGGVVMGEQTDPRSARGAALIPPFIDFEEHHHVAHSRDNTLTHTQKSPGSGVQPAVQRALMQQTLQTESSTLRVAAEASKCICISLHTLLGCLTVSDI